MLEYEIIQNRTTRLSGINHMNENIYTDDKRQNMLDHRDIKDFEKIEIMNEFLGKNTPKFDENFELIEYVNSGSTGIVYKGKSKSENNPQSYSFKFFIPKNPNKKNAISRYHEIINQKKLHHKNIVQILAFYKINSTDFFSVSEFGKYGDLDKLLDIFLKKKYLSETFVNYIAKQILEGLNYMHRKQFIHMDVKKANIVINSNFDAQLIDFSSTFSLKAYQPEDIIIFPMIGTGRYMPPELLNKTKMEAKYGGKIDMYSLGVTLYHLCFGFYPYGLNNVKGDDCAKMAEQLNNANLEFPKGFDVSCKLKNFLRKLLEKDYRKRFSVKEALNDPWIKGWELINEEKENIVNLENFIIKLISDSIPKFNEYLKNNESVGIEIQNKERKR